MSAPNLADALAYAARGWHIFPTLLIVTSQGVLKKPAIAKWPEVASYDPAVVTWWWHRWPEAVPSLVTGPKNKLVVLDIDVKANRNGFDTLNDLGRGALPETPMAHTRSGGLHLYFRDAGIRNSNGYYGIGPGVDVRGYNGQAVLPCATSGYRWDPLYNFDTVEPRPAPGWFNHRQTKQRDINRKGGRFNALDVLAEACRRIRHAPEGTRHDTYRHETFRIARLVGLGLLDGRIAKNDLEVEVMALGIAADGHTGRVEKYFYDSWDEGLDAGRSARR